MEVGDIARQNPLETPLVQNNHVVQTFPPYGANGPFGIKSRDLFGEGLSSHGDDDR